MPTEELQAESAVSESVRKKTAEAAEKIEKELVELMGLEGPQTWKKAELIFKIHDLSIWQIRGFESETAYRVHLMHPKATWFERRRVWGDWAKPALDSDKITRARLNRMQWQNAKQLMRLGDKRQWQDKWIEWALSLSEDELELKVDHALGNESEPEEGLGQPESTVILKLYGSQSQKDMILDTVHEFLKRQGLPLDAEMRGLELGLADWKGGWPESGPIIPE